MKKLISSAALAVALMAATSISPAFAQGGAPKLGKGATVTSEGNSSECISAIADVMKGNRPGVYAFLNKELPKRNTAQKALDDLKSRTAKLVGWTDSMPAKEREELLGLVAAAGCKVEIEK